MIKLAKSSIPDWLANNQIGRTAEYIAAPKSNKPRPWSNFGVKDALKIECHNKCMYCEANPEDSSYPAVEHIKPKETFPDLVLAWENLGWACTKCNTNKGSYWSEHQDLRLLNPYEDDPEEHIDHAGPMVITALDSERGKNTIRQLALNRVALFASKAQRLQELDDRIQMWHSEIDGDKKDVLAEDVQHLLDSNSEFSATLRVFAAKRQFPQQCPS